MSKLSRFSVVSTGSLYGNGPPIQLYQKELGPTWPPEAVRFGVNKLGTLVRIIRKHDPYPRTEVEELPASEWKLRNWLVRCLRHDVVALLAREEWARKLAEICYGGDERAVEMFMLHMRFRNEEVDPEPVREQGILFYQVYRGTQHSERFYVGIKDDVLFRCWVGKDILRDAKGNEIQDTDGKPMVGFVRYVSEIPDLDSYESIIRNGRRSSLPREPRRR